MKCLAERELAHVGQMPTSLREALAADSNQGRRAIRSLYRKTPINKVSRDGLTGPAADVEYCRALREERRESIEPRAFDPAGTAAVRDVVVGVSFVQIDDRVGVRGHEVATVGGRHIMP